MIEAPIYSKLQDTISSLTGGTGGAFTNSFSSAFSQSTPGRIYPTVPTENTQVPFAVFTVTSAEPSMSLRGPVGLTTYMVRVDMFAVTFEESRIMAETVVEGLHGWREGTILLSMLSTYNSTPLEQGYQYTAEFKVHQRT